MTSIELPAGGDLERAVRAFVAFETGFDAEAGGTGRHRTVGMCLGGTVAQRLNDGDVGTEFDRAERPGGFVSLDVVVDAPLSNGILAALGVLIGTVPMIVLIRVARGASADVKLTTIFGQAVIATFLGMLGGWLGSRRVHQASAESE